MKIRAALRSDEARVTALWEICGLTRAWNDAGHDFRFAIEGPASCVLIGERGSELVASAMVGHDGHRGALYYLAVHPAFRGRGFGRAMQDAAAQWLRERGVWKINLMVRRDNAQANRFYEKLGYAENAVISFGKRIDGA